MVDRARLVSREPSKVKVEGRTQMAAVNYEWFRCRITLPPLPRTQGPNSGSARVQTKPAMLFATIDLSGDPVKLTISDTVEVRSVEQGYDTVLFELDGEPQPIRKKRKVIGQEVTIRRVDVATRERLP